MASLSFLTERQLIRLYVLVPPLPPSVMSWPPKWPLKSPVSPRLPSRSLSRSTLISAPRSPLPPPAAFSRPSTAEVCADADSDREELSLPAPAEPARPPRPSPTVPGVLAPNGPVAPPPSLSGAPVYHWYRNVCCSFYLAIRSGRSFSCPECTLITGHHRHTILLSLTDLQLRNGCAGSSTTALSGINCRCVQSLWLSLKSGGLSCHMSVAARADVPHVTSSDQEPSTFQLNGARRCGF